MFPVGPEVLVGLVVIAILAGVGSTMIGPGGIFITIALYVFTPLSSAEVAGTAHTLFIGVCLIGAFGYLRSGELRGTEERSLAVVLSIAGMLGAITGAYMNAFVTREQFGMLLGLLTAATGVVLLYREIRGLEPTTRIDWRNRRGRIVLGFFGFVLGVAAGLVGIGGPVIVVPALVILGMPILLALGVAQVQAVFISGFAATGYIAQGAISTGFVLVLGVPILAGAIGGWLLAHWFKPGRLKELLGVVLVPTGLYLMF